jgi:uncharacterized membrane protein YtjA (UPF0391 family)
MVRAWRVRIRTRLDARFHASVSEHSEAGAVERIYYALVLIVVALLAALFGFGGVSATAMSGAHLLIWVAVVVIVIGVVLSLMRRGRA